MEQSQQVSDNDVTQALTESGSLDISVSRIPVNENSMSLLEARAEPNNNYLFNEQSIPSREKRFHKDEALKKQKYKLRKISDESNSGKQYLDKEVIETSSDSSGDDDGDENSFLQPWKKNERQ